MAKNLHFPAMPVAEEFDVGDDSDLPGYGQPIGPDDIDALVSDGSSSVEDRRGILTRMLDDLQARRAMDETNEYAGLIGRIDDALAVLDLPGDGIGDPGAFAFNEGDRVEQPDEVLEREEEEAAAEAEERRFA